MRMFALHRDVDVSGISGTGMVAEGCEFTDGSVVMHWLSDTSSTTVFKNMKDLEAVHGHMGSTRVVWHEEAAAAEMMTEQKSGYVDFIEWE